MFVFKLELALNLPIENLIFQQKLTNFIMIFLFFR